MSFKAFSDKNQNEALARLARLAEVLVKKQQIERSFEQKSQRLTFFHAVAKPLGMVAAGTKLGFDSLGMLASAFRLSRVSGFVDSSNRAAHNNKGMTAVILLSLGTICGIYCHTRAQRANAALLAEKEKGIEQVFGTKDDGVQKRIDQLLFSPSEKEVLKKLYKKIEGKDFLTSSDAQEQVVLGEFFVARAAELNDKFAKYCRGYVHAAAHQNSDNSSQGSRRSGSRSNTSSFISLTS